jgi:6-pyruvoyl-tetrahydropterin synthase
MTSKSEVWITTEFVGFHRWPEAPDEVYYLRNLHRHLFKVKVTVPIEEDRQIEFHMLKADVDSALAESMLRSDNNRSTFSCEQTAELLAKAAIGHYAIAWARAEVSEDGECGSTVFVEREAK